MCYIFYRLSNVYPLNIIGTSATTNRFNQQLVTRTYFGNQWEFRSTVGSFENTLKLQIPNHLQTDGLPYSNIPPQYPSELRQYWRLHY